MMEIHMTKKMTILARNGLLFLLIAILLTSGIAGTAAPAKATSPDSTAAETAEPNVDTDEDTETDPTDSEPDESESFQFQSIAKSAILMEASTGTILYEKDADQAMPPASITKTMTLLLAFEALQRGDIAWDDMVFISERAWRETGSKMFLLVDTKVPLEEIITGISVVSANDGCIAIAEHISGSVEAFVQLMNKRSQELGLSNTQFQNPHGLPAEGPHHMSAQDIATLARYLIRNHPKVLEFESMTDFTYSDILQKNYNPLLGVYPGADGLKTGWTEEAGFNLVGTAERDDLRFISVVLNTESEAQRLAASRELLDYGFQNFKITEVVTKGQAVGDTDVKDGKELTVPLKTNDSVVLVLHKDKIDEIQLQPVIDEEIITAPVKNGTKAGTLEVRLDGKVLADVDISTTQDVEKAGFLEILWRGIVSFFKSIFQVTTEE